MSTLTLSFYKQLTVRRCTVQLFSYKMRQWGAKILCFMYRNVELNAVSLKENDCTYSYYGKTKRVITLFDSNKL
jgi:hypothetical protein